MKPFALAWLAVLAAIVYLLGSNAHAVTVVAAHPVAVAAHPVITARPAAPVARPAAPRAVEPITRPLVVPVAPPTPRCDTGLRACGAK